MLAGRFGLGVGLGFSGLEPTSGWLGCSVSGWPGISGGFGSAGFSMSGSSGFSGGLGKGLVWIIGFLCLFLV